MKESHYQFMRRKQRKKRIIVIFLICVLLSIIAVSLRECNQNMTEPLNKEYRPVDQPNAQLLSNLERA